MNIFIVLGSVGRVFFWKKMLCVYLQDNCEWPLIIFPFVHFPETFEQSISDFNECLKIQKELLEAENRLIAESYPLKVT